MKKCKPDVTLESVGCVSALEFVGLKLSACVSLTSTDIIRLLEGVDTSTDDVAKNAFTVVIKSLRKRIKTVSFTSPVASCGRVKLIPDSKNTDVQDKYFKIINNSKKTK